MEYTPLPSIYDFVEEKKFDHIFESYVAEAAGRNPVIEDAPTEDEIIKAIKSRNYIGVYYEEPTDESEEIVKKGFRLIEPYVFGTGYVMNGSILYPDRQYMRVFVIRDTEYDPQTKDKFANARRKSVSKTKRVPYWRLMRVDRMGSWTKIPKVFSKYRELYTGGTDKHIANIITSLSHDDFPRGESKLRLPRKLRNKVNAEE